MRASDRRTYTRDGITVRAIDCEALTKAGRPCGHAASWRQADSGRLLCDQHRYVPLPEAPTVEELFARHAEAFEDRPDYGAGARLAFVQDADALRAWSCPGEESEHWPEGLRLLERPTGERTASVSCGWCGVRSDLEGMHADD